MIAYTVGHTASYHEVITTEPNPTKIGCTSDYEGGWVWRSIEEAQTFLNSDAWFQVDWGDGKLRDPKQFSAYGVVLPNGWEQDVIVEDGMGHLLVDAKLFEVEQC